MLNRIKLYFLDSRANHLRREADLAAANAADYWNRSEEMRIEAVMVEAEILRIERKIGLI